MEITEQYRWNAHQALKFARDSASAELRRQWLTIAGEWIALAEARTEALGIQLPGEKARACD